MGGGIFWVFLGFFDRNFGDFDLILQI